MGWRGGGAATAAERWVESGVLWCGIPGLRLLGLLEAVMGQRGGGVAAELGLRGGSVRVA